jgi:peptidoglycan hydrolase CwlO-like protein
MKKIKFILTIVGSLIFLSACNTHHKITRFRNYRVEYKKSLTQEISNLQNEISHLEQQREKTLGELDSKHQKLKRELKHLVRELNSITTK